MQYKMNGNNSTKNKRDEFTYTMAKREELGVY